MAVSFSSVTTPQSDGENFITNPNAEIDTSGWNLYNNSGRTVPASVVDQDITYTAVASGGAGNGVVINYIFHATQSYTTPLVTVVSSTLITVAWYNGPTIANNPTATQIQTAYNAVSAATLIATLVISGNPSNRQYINGASTLANGGDTAPTTGTGGTITGVALTRNTTAPLAGVADFLLTKDAVSREGMGVSTDFDIDNKDKGNEIQISLVYQGDAGMVLGTNSDIRIWIYDITNAVLIPIVPTYTLAGPTGSILTFLGTFTASPTSLNYRLIFHIGTSNASTWNFTFDEVVATDIITPGAAVDVPSLVLEDQPVSGSVTDHMVVMWTDGATDWVPATVAGAALPRFGTDTTQLGFATEIVDGLADIYIRGALDGFSFGPFTGYDQYIDNTAGLISPLPSPFTDLYVSVGKAISATVLNIQFQSHVDEISNGSGVPLKGGLLTNTGTNAGGGDSVLSVGANGNALIANSAAADGIQWAAPIVAAAPFTFTLATRTLTAATATDSVAGFLSAADHTTYTGYAASIALKAALASPTFTGTPTLPTGTIGVTQAAGNSTTALATTAFVTTANNLKAPLASPVFTGDVNVSTGNLLVSTLGKGVSIKKGTNAKIGSVALVAGTVTVSNTSVTANSLIFLTEQTTGGTVGFTRISAIVVGASFTITSSNPLDTSTIAWWIVEQIP